ncbi:MAG: OadG family protein [Lachnospiraceae bacterium]|nr:OadG family protein [Lachnospiraceae bacterium]
MILQIVMPISDLETASQLTRQYNKEELRAVFDNAFYNAFQYQVDAELGAFDGLVTSYAQMVTEMGGEPTVGPSKSKVLGKEIVVTYVMYGNNCDGEVVFTFSNDIFARFKSGAASAHTTFAQKMSAAGRQMGNAGMNTLLGMGSVFIMLIAISLIISSFSLFNKKGKGKDTKTVTAPAAPAAASAEPEEELADDSELVAVITAAIAAYEGSAVSAGPDGFVVRSIRKANRRR